MSRAEASGATIVVLDRNRGDDTLGCLGRLAGAALGRARIAVMDNRSRKGSVAALRERSLDVLRGLRHGLRWRPPHLERLGLREPAAADAAPHPVGS